MSRATKLALESDGTFTKKPLRQRYHQFPDGSRVQRDLYSAYLTSFVSESRLDVKQAAQAWTGAKVLLRAAADGFEPASGRGFALPQVTLGVGAGRSKRCSQKLREAGDGVTATTLVLARAPESGAIVEYHDGS